MKNKNSPADPRMVPCRINQWGKHRWSNCFKDKISKTAYFQVLRCRYCLQYLLAQFERTTLPSGRVALTESIGIIPPKQVDELRMGYATPNPTVATVNGIDTQHV